MSEKKRGRGRPKAEHTIPENWEEIIINAGKEGKHITQFLIDLKISRETHSNLLARNKKYFDTVQTYNELCENWWFNNAHDSMKENGGMGYNSRLWSLIMRNKFGDRWSESSKVDITSKDEPINAPIQIEIIKTNSNKDA